MRPPFETFKGSTCKGCYAMGNACGKCEKCEWERSLSDQISKFPTITPEYLRLQILAHQSEMVAGVISAEFARQQQMAAISEFAESLLGRPKFCECGGPLVYSEAFGRTFSYCDKCTPMTTIKVPRASLSSPPDKEKP